MPRIRSANISQNILTGTLNVSTINVSTITLANGQDLAGTGNLAYNQANAARDQANTAREQANTARDQANAAYLAANNANLLLGGVITGTLNVTQDIIVGGNVYLEGNTTFINVATYSVEDSLIYLASNNKLTDSIDIGFMGGKNTSGTYAHTGFVRDATDAKWKLFDGLPEEGHIGNVIDFSNAYLATLVANVEANTLSVVNGVSGNVNFDSGTLFVDSVGDRVGVGATSLSAKFQVEAASGNAVLITGGAGGNPIAIFRRSVGAAANVEINATGSDPQITFDNNTNKFALGVTGSSFYITDDASLSANVSNVRLAISSTGNVGVGIVNTSQRLYVGITSTDLANGVLSSANSYPIARFMNHASGGGIRGLEIGGPTGGIDAPVYVKVTGTSARFSVLNDTGTEQLTILNGGNVGIGSTSPQVRLDLGTQGGAVIKLNPGTTISSLPYSGFAHDDLLIGGIFSSSYPHHQISFGHNADASRKFSIGSANSSTFNASTIFVPALTITSGGLVGIGTTSPVQKLHIEGNPAIGTTGTEDVLILGRALSGGVSFQQAASLKLGRYQNAGGAFESYTRLDFALRDNSSSSNYNTNTTVMTLTNAGNVGIGTTSPVDKLDVYGSIVIRDAYNLTWGGTYGVDIPTIVGVKGVSSYIGFYPSGSSFSEQVRITRNGSVGIGTSTIDFGKLHIRQTGITAAAISTGWPAYNAELATQSKYVLHLDAGGNGSVVAQGQGPSATLSLGGYYDSRGIITMIGAGGGSPSDQGNGYGKDLMVKAGNSDNGNGLIGGRLFLAGGSGYSGGAFGSNYGQVVLQPQGGGVSIGTSSSVSRLKVDGSVSVGPQGKLSFIGLDINSGGTPTYVKIITTIPFVSGGADFTVNIKGYAYGYSSVADLSICWHYYNSTFYNPTVISKGSWAPTVRLSAEGGFVAIVLSTPEYWPKLYVESMYSSSYADSYATGWTWVDANASGSPIVTLSYKSNFGNQFVMGSDGNVGIGTAPSTKLHVFGGDGITVDASGATDNSYLQCREAGVARFSIYENSDVVYLNSHNSMVFRANQLGGSGGVIRLDGGNVGIGTSPAGKLDVLGEIYVDGNKAIDRVSSVNAGVTYMVLGNGGLSGTAALSALDLRTPNPQHFINGGMSFGFTSYDLNNTDTNGWADYIHVNSYTDSSGGNPNIFLINRASSGVKIARQTYNSSSNYNAGTIYTLNFTAASDGSVKEDVQNITGALDKIMQLRPVTFKWTDEYILNGMSRNSNEHTFDPETNQVIIPEEKTVNVGLIAQEVEAVIPTVVHQENVKLKGAENYLKNISYDKLVPHLIAALQELKREFDEYKQTHP